MELFEVVETQATILRSAAALFAEDEAERLQAVSAIVRCGSAGRWCLDIAILHAAQPRVQFAAAVGLHRLGDRRGLVTLLEALKWRLPSEPLIAPNLESAFLAIGSPDAVEALIPVWNMLPWGDHEQVRTSICRIWAGLKNPLVLPILSESALSNPDRFEQTVAAFGEFAVPMLRDMSRDQEPRRRAIAVQTVGHISVSSAFETLLPMLQDTDPIVRGLVPEALERAGTREGFVGLSKTVKAISQAVRSGFPSVQAISALNRRRPDDLSETLTCLLETWSPDTEDSSTSDILLMTMANLVRASGDTRRAARAACRMLRFPIRPHVAAAVIHAIETLARKSGGADRATMECLSEQLATPNAEVRQQAAQSLGHLGDMFPNRMIAFLQECKPRDSFFSQLQVILRGGRDAGLAATQAFQEVSKWWARLTSEGHPHQPIHPASPPSATLPEQDYPRLAEMLRHLLSSAVNRRYLPMTAAEVEELVSFIVTLLRAMSRLGLPAVRDAWQEIVSVLHMPADAFAVLGQPIDSRWHETTSAAAAETIIALYPSDSFGLFLEALYSPRVECMRTGIAALGMLGDSRSLSHLRVIADSDRHACSAMAAQAIAHIQRTNPEMMTLLRGAHGTIRDPSVLLRPATGNNGEHSSDLLLRPTASHAE